MRRHTALMYTVVLVAIIFLLGCSTDKQITEPETPAPPDLPSVSTMTMDVDFFQSAQIDTQSVTRGKLDESLAAAPAALKLNYINAAARIFFLNVVAYAALARPVAVFATAVHSVPQYQRDGSWLWTYIYVDNHGSEYSVFLKGKRMDTSVAWSLEVSSNDPALLLDHFLWFAGEVANYGHSGYWQFYEPQSDAAKAAPALAGNEAGTPGVQCVRIDWQNSSAIDQHLAFLINKPDDSAEGSKLVFEEALEMSMIEFYDAANDNSGTIIWNRDGSGSIEWPDYKEGIKSCWDVWQYDVDCP
jgi:hypothetical protein